MFCAEDLRDYEDEQPLTARQRGNFIVAFISLR